MYKSLADYYDEILRLVHEAEGKLTDKEKRKLRPIKKLYKEEHEKETRNKHSEGETHREAISEGEGE